MGDAAKYLFEQLNKYGKIEELVADGESEYLLIECKAPTVTKLNRDLKAKLGKAISGFANSEGGLVLWGVETDNHSHSGLDLMTQITPIPNIERFVRGIQNAIPTLTTPGITSFDNRVLKKKKHDSKGIAVTLIPKTSWGPVRTNTDEQFYFRSGDQFVTAPYELIKRLFVLSEVPAVRLLFQPSLVVANKQNEWKIPLVLENNSPAIAEHIVVMLTIDNPNSCASIDVHGFQDVSDINPGSSVYSRSINQVIHKGLPIRIGDLRVKMKTNRQTLRSLKLTIEIFAHKMERVKHSFTLHLTRSGFSVKNSSTTTGY